MLLIKFISYNSKLLKDNSVVILDTKTKSVESVQCSIRPVFLSWHPLSHFFIVTSREGEAVLFDVGLSQLDFVPIRMVSFFSRLQNRKYSLKILVSLDLARLCSLLLQNMKPWLGKMLNMKKYRH